MNALFVQASIAQSRPPAFRFKLATATRMVTTEPQTFRKTTWVEYLERRRAKQQPYQGIWNNMCSRDSGRLE